MNKILIASNNPGKIKEYRFLLSPLGYEVVSLLDLNDIDDVKEVGSTFLENAMIKAEASAIKYGIPTIADDSGLMVEVLDNAPGIYSKRYSKEAKDQTNNLKLLKNLQGKQNRKAKFVCEIVYFDPLAGYSNFHGEIEGVILDEMRGTNGFGYDPIFYIPSEKKTMAELDLFVKNRISHRAIALHKCMTALKENQNEASRL
ncbi:MAG: RdgB/HAM1 family non-canonical purine NTP pyrophosphatase [Firmicutes bacterium]|nr:RdgB/HAM1 family non-canonical purine NTP pyrophosphatase [Bacillota bacterium]